MMRRLRAFAAVLALVGVILPATCLCVPASPGAAGGEHDCCLPQTGMRLFHDRCCDQGRSDVLVDASPVPMPALSPTAAVLPQPAALAAQHAPRVLVAVSSPPSTVLRV